MRAPVVIVCLAFWATLSAQQQPENLRERIRASQLPPDAREALAAAFASKNYARMQEVLDHQPAGPSPHPGELQALTGDVEFLRGRMDRADQAFRNAEALAPLVDSDRFTWAMALVELGDFAGARRQLDLLSSRHPSAPLYIYWLGRIDYYQRLYDAAVEKFNRVIALDPTSARAYDNLGLSFDMLGRSGEAREALEKAVELNRKLAEPSAWPPHNLGYLEVRLEQFKDAEKALRESLKYDPHLAIAHYHLGRALEGDGRDAEAIEEYRAAVASKPRAVEALYSLGLLYRRHGRTAEADAAFSEYRKLKAESPQN
ncbi:MAG TPA: tetratricopeptide repeat protein [Bryobacteraceae bacterium]|nr:tetratricopeptide repeat protein [Bryobacteraceae bacterium]